MTEGISNSGDSAEALFRRLTNTVKPGESRLGDAELNGRYIEVKAASRDTLNQVRAVKYIPLVAYDKNCETWYVVPPHCVVALVSVKLRGQHTENPYESSTLSLAKLGRFKVSDPSHLRTAVQAAIESGDRFPALRDEMESILKSARRLSVDSRAKVTQTLRALDLA